MTVVVALKTDTGMYMASDGLTIQDHTTISSCEKKFQELFPNFWIGIGGLSSMKTLMRNGFEVPKHDGENLQKYLIKEFVPNLKEFMKNNEYLVNNENEPSRIESDMIICYEKNIYYLSNDFDLTPINNDYFAIGTGKLYAMTKLYGTGNIDPIPRLKKAIEASSHFDMACGGEIYIKKIF
ncbi:hypothetical protein MBCUT_06690 [Methanobrevibacter cuticularis]|uniref:Proteasome subunit beta n=1 Tax=Methanobrevibacter cuticularis TaxID=47311 RepID=A0A166EGM1_9EURY|nr:hypothetical protein [Methanobrevibacter cuticularis]KZX16631.1 hypothetical protein MBCUT_06690 [Methanobrevibacter cuticularis]